MIQRETARSDPISPGVVQDQDPGGQGYGFHQRQPGGHRARPEQLFAFTPTAAGGALHYPIKGHGCLDNNLRIADSLLVSAVTNYPEPITQVKP